MSGGGEIPFGAGLIARRARVDRGEVAWIRYVLEAHDGLANFFTTGDGLVTFVAPDERRAELDRLLADLVEERSLIELLPAPE